MRYVYIKSSEPTLWTVGFYDPAGVWQPESDHTSSNSAANRVHWLNGGELNKRKEEIIQAIKDGDMATFHGAVADA